MKFGISGRKKIIAVTAIGMATVTGLYFFLTGSFFLCRAVLPLVQLFCGMDIYAGRIDWRPWSSGVAVWDLRIGAAKAPLLTIRHAEGEYSAAEFIRGVINCRRLNAVGVGLHFRRTAAGWYLADDEPAGEAAFATTPYIPRFNLRNVNISDSMITLSSIGEQRDFYLTWRNLTLNVPLFKNGSLMNINAAGNTGLRLKTSGLDGTFHSRTELAGSILWRDDLMPEHSELKLAFTGHGGNIGETRLRKDSLQLELISDYADGKFSFPGVELQQHLSGSFLRAHGSVGTEPFALDCNLERSYLAPELLAFASLLFFDVNPGIMSFGGSGRLEYDVARVVCSGQWTLNRVDGAAFLHGRRCELPGFILTGEQDFTFSTASPELAVRKLQLDLQLSGRKAMRMALRKPLQYRVKEADFSSGGKAGIDLDIDRLDLSLLHFLLPEDFIRCDSGTLSGKISLLLPVNPGERAALSGRLQTDGTLFYAVLPEGMSSCGYFALRGINAGLELDAEITQEQEFFLKKCETTLTAAGEICGSIRIGGKYIRSKQDGEFNVEFANFSPGTFLAAQNCGTLLNKMAVNGRISGRIYPDSLTIGDAGMTLRTPDGALQAKMTLEPQRWIFARRSFAGQWSVKSDFSADLPRFNFLLPPNVRIEGGTLNGTVTLRGAADFSTTSAAGRFNLNDGILNVGGKKYGSLTLRNECSLYIPASGRWQFSNGQTLCRVNGKSALRIDGNSFYDPAVRQWESNWQIRYLNEHLANMLLENTFSELEVSGNIRLKHLFATPEGGSQELLLQLTCPEARLNGNDRSFNWSVSSEYSRNAGKWRAGAGLSIGVTDRTAADLQFSATGAEAIVVQSNLIDYPLLKALLTVPQSSPPELPPVPPSVSGAPFKATLELKKITLSDDLSASLRGSLASDGREWRSDDTMLTLNGVPLSIQFSLRDTARKQLALELQSKLLRPLPLSPVVTFIEPSYQVNGSLRRFNLALRGTTADWGVPPDLTGVLEADFSDVKIGNQAAKGPLARLFLLPLETLFRFNALIPLSTDVRKQWRIFRGHFLSSSTPLAEFFFDRGEILLTARDGELALERFDFTGPVVEKLRFRGGMGLRDDFPLSLQSELGISTMSISMPVKGTLSDPSIGLHNLGMAIVGDNFNHIVEKMSALLPGRILPEKKEQKRSWLPFWDTVKSIWGD